MYFFPKTGFRNFRNVSTNNTLNITYCVCINKFPQNLGKSAEKFSNFEKSAQRLFRGAFGAGADIRYGEVWRSPHHNHLWCGEKGVRHTTKQQFELDFAHFLISIRNSVRFGRFRHPTNFDEIRRWLSRFSAEMAKIVKRWLSQKFWSKFFWSESIQNGLKRILKRKSRNRNFFSV